MLGYIQVCIRVRVGMRCSAYYDTAVRRLPVLVLDWWFCSDAQDDCRGQQELSEGKRKKGGRKEGRG